jgi:Arc/MetJ-type ribon-helix-helix transcriptional regulator
MSAPKHPDDLLVSVLQRFTRKQLIDMGKLIKQGNYETRTELVREAIQQLLDKKLKK